MQDHKCLYKCVASTSMKPDKVFLRTTEGDFKQRFNNHKQPLNNSNYHNDTQHSPNTLGTSKKNATKPQFCKDSSIIFKYNDKVFLVPPRKVRYIILP